MTAPLFWCRVCKNKRPESGKCRTCGTGRTPAYEAKPVPVKCPRCGDSRSKPTDDRSRVCQKCGAEFEPVEVSFCDSRPDVNAMKREEYERGTKRR